MNNANLTLFDRKNSNDTEEHAVFNFVMREDPVSDELKAATIAGMKQRLEAKRQREARRRRITKRVIAAAAVVLVLLFITPLGGRVTSAAESFFSSVSDWMSSVFRISHSRTDADEEERFKIELTEAMLENDSIYVSFKTNNELLKLSAEGKIYDETGNSIPLYANPCRAGDIGSVSQEYGDLSGWRMYAPGLPELIQSSDGDLRCELTVTASMEYDDYIPAHIEKKHFDFVLEGANSILKIKRYSIGKKIKKNGAVFHFIELLDSDNSQTLVVEIIPDKGNQFHPKDWFTADVETPKVETDDGFEYIGGFSYDHVYRIGKNTFVLLMEFSSNYSGNRIDGDFHGFHEYYRQPYQINVRSVTYNQFRSEKVVTTKREPGKYGTLPEIYLPIEYNKRGEIETKYEDVSFPVAGGVTIRLNGIEKNRTGTYGYEFADRKPDYMLNFTVDQGDMMPITSGKAGKHADVQDGANTTTKSEAFPVVFSAMSKGREVFRLRCRMSFDAYENMRLENGHYVNKGVIWLDRPYMESLDAAFYGEDAYISNFAADDMNMLKNAIGDYPSLKAIFKRCEIDTLRLVSVAMIVDTYETKYDADSYDPDKDPNYVEYEKWLEKHMWYQEITLADPNYYDIKMLQKQTVRSYTKLEWKTKTAKVNLSLVVQE